VRNTQRHCAWCGVLIPEHRATQARYCCRQHGKRASRAKDPEKAREQVRQANRRRYKTDPAYRAGQVRINRERRQILSYGKVTNDPLLMHKDRYRHARALGYRSGLEVAVARQLERAGVEFGYETLKLQYRVEETRRYTPDIILTHNGIVIELKGHFVTAERKKMKFVKAQYPNLDIRFVFSNPNTRISKTSKTTYGKWAADHGFPYAAKLIPEAWLRERPHLPSLAIIKTLMEE
jgi:hypothetical protein